MRLEERAAFARILGENFKFRCVMVSICARMSDPIVGVSLEGVDLRAEYDQRGVIQKVVDLVMSLVRQVMYSIAFLYHRLLLVSFMCRAI